MSHQMKVNLGNCSAASIGRSDAILGRSESVMGNAGCDAPVMSSKQERVRDLFENPVWKKVVEGSNPTLGDPSITVEDVIEQEVDGKDHAKKHQAAIARELHALGEGPPHEHARSTESEHARSTDDNRLSTRAKCMIMGQESVGQFLFKHTNTMLPRKHQAQLTPLLKLFSQGIIVIDVFSGGDHAAIAFLAPLSGLSRWVPERMELVDERNNTGEAPNGEPQHSGAISSKEYVVQTAVRLPTEEVQVECIARKDLKEQDSWQLGKNRRHTMNEFPKKHLVRLSSISGSTQAFKLIWDTMALVFIWERNAGDDLAALIQHIASL